MGGLIDSFGGGDALRSDEEKEGHFQALQILLPLFQKSTGMGLRLVLVEGIPVPVQLIEESDLRLLVDPVHGVDEGPRLMGTDEMEGLGDQLVKGRADARLEGVADEQSEGLRHDSFLADVV
jgi:hypothetical protein